MNATAKAILRSAGTLTLIAAVATAALAGTHALTAVRIAQNEEEVATQTRQTVIEADAFAPQSLPDGTTYYVATKEDTVAGYVFTVVTSGKSSGLTVMTGVSVEGTITGVAITTDNETAGYVDKVTKGGLPEALRGQRTTDGVDTVSQATKTSKGVLNGVQQALEYYKQISG